MILSRYLMREIAVPFLLGLFALTSIFMINQFVRLADLFVGRGMSAQSLIQVLGIMVPPFLLITLPAAIFLAGIVAFSRLSADGEAVALKAAGISFGQLMRPVVLVAFVVSAMALTVGLVFEPWGKGKLKHLVVAHLQENTGLAITPGTFNNLLFGDVVVYAEKASSSGHLTDIFISDDRDPNRPLLVTASKGALVKPEGESFLGLHLTGGEIFRPGESVQRVRFAEYDVKLQLKSNAQTIYADRAAFRAEIKKREAAGQTVTGVLHQWLDRSKNVTYGVACFIFGLLGPALGLHHVRSGRMGGFTLGVVLILVYYLLMSVAQALVIGQHLPVDVGAWLPNGLFLAGTIYVLLKAQGEGRIGA